MSLPLCDSAFAAVAPSQAWTPDEEADACELCRTSFTFFVRDPCSPSTVGWQRGKGWYEIAVGWQRGKGWYEIAKLYANGLVAASMCTNVEFFPTPARHFSYLPVDFLRCPFHACAHTLFPPYCRPSFAIICRPLLLENYAFIRFSKGMGHARLVKAKRFDADLSVEPFRSATNLWLWLLLRRDVAQRMHKNQADRLAGRQEGRQAHAQMHVREFKRMRK
eukprot:6174437-Pleurochrysis_carterae.AAC.1